MSYDFTSCMNQVKQGHAVVFHSAADPCNREGARRSVSLWCGTSCDQVRINGCNLRFSITAIYKMVDNFDSICINTQGCRASLSSTRWFGGGGWRTFKNRCLYTHACLPFCR